jgi:voltage-gated potassium channel
MEHKSHAYLVFMLALSLMALGALAVEAAFTLDEGTRTILGYADLLVCLVFFTDFLVLLYRAENKLKYLATWGWLDLLSSVPAVSAFRWGRSARIVRILRVLRGVRAARILTRIVMQRRAESTVLAAVLMTIILLVVSSISILHFEAQGDGNIRTPQDAVWWAIATITTVGYGDKVPVTPEGQLTAAVLMLAGLSVIATVSGSFAAWFLAPAGERRDDRIAALHAEVAELKSMLTAMGGGTAR